MAQDKLQRELVTSLDVGTSRVLVVVAERHADKTFEIIAQASHPSHGIKQGVVVNIESTVHAIKEVIGQVELIAGCKIEEVVVNIAGTHIASRDTTGMVAISHKEVSKEDVQRVLDSASTVALTADQHVLHVLPQEFMIDSQSGVLEPVGMAGVRLEAKVHMITCATSAIQNLMKCVRQCQLRVNSVVLESLAASKAVLTEDERELGICLIDIGAGTTDLVVFFDGAIRHISTIPIAGQQVTRDIAMLLRTPHYDAEKIKLNHACAWSELASAEEIVEVPSVGGRAPREMTIATLAPAVEARYAELLKSVREHLINTGYYDMLRAGIVLTGGASKVFGLVELVEEVMEMPARVGEPHGVKSLVNEVFDPQFATSIGLLKYVSSNDKSSSIEKQNERSNVVKKMTGWIGKHF